MLSRSAAAALVTFLLAPQAQSTELALHGPLLPGALVQGMAAPGARIRLNDRAIAVAPDGRFAFGIGRNARSTATLSIIWPDGKREWQILPVARRKWLVQRIDGLPPRSVTPSPEDLVRIKAERATLREARNRVTPESWFRGGFVWPAAGKISGIYGSQRILNGEPRQPHLGVDIAAPEGTPVVAAADGVVSLAHDGMFFTGKTVAIDHGLGVGTLYAHLNAVTVQAGQRVRRGEMIGRIGRTGRVTGAHLHWGLSWFDMRLDPALAVAPEPVALGAAVGGPRGEKD